MEAIRTEMYSFVCNLQSNFISASPEKQRVGYITDFAGLGLFDPLVKDLTVHTPFSTTYAYAPLIITQNRAYVVAIIEKLEWGGGRTDPLIFNCYMSAQNANLLKGLTLMPLKTTSIQTLGYCVSNYDEVTNAWFEEFYPQLPL